MRIAVLYSGFLNGWNLNLPSNRTCLFTDETDLYFYTYDEPTNVTIKQYVPIGTQTQKELVFYSSEYYRKVRDLHGDNKYYTPAQHANILQQWHNLFVGFCLVPDDYDVYIKSRGEIMLHGKIDFHQYDMSKKVVYIPSGNDFAGINDQFAFGNYEVMRIYYELYIDYFKIHGFLIPYSPETSLLEHLVRNRIEIIRTNPPNTIER
jgi:hypothetical protein